ncbi:hypothetical protein D3C71_1604150 [compost metagenome]
MIVLVILVVEAGDELVSAPEQGKRPLQCQVQAALGLVGFSVVTQHSRSAGFFIDPGSARRGLIRAVVVIAIGIHVVRGQLDLPVIGKSVLGGHEIVGGFQLVVHPAGAGTGRAGEVGLLAVGEQQRYTR